MKNNSVLLPLARVFMVILISSTLLSCTGLQKSEPKLIEEKISGIGKQVSELNDRIWVVFQDSKKNYWFGSNGEGIYHYDGQQLRQITTDDGLVDNTIRGVQEDERGNIYIETPDGISKYDGDSFKTLKGSTSPHNQWELNPKDMWFKYNANDVYRYDGDSLYELELPRKNLNKAFGMEVEGVPFESNNNSPYAVYGLSKDTDGNIWFGTATAGVFRYNGNSFLWIAEKELSTLPDGRVPGVRSILQDKDGYYWLSNFKSKYKVESHSSEYQKMKAVDIPEEVIAGKLPYFIDGLSDTNGDLWMITYHGGVWLYDGLMLTNTEIKNDQGNVLLISIFQDDTGVLWLGTDNDGVYRQTEGTFEKFVIE